MNKKVDEKMGTRDIPVMDFMKAAQEIIEGLSYYDELEGKKARDRQQDGKSGKKSKKSWARSLARRPRRTLRFPMIAWETQPIFWFVQRLSR